MPDPVSPRLGPQKDFSHRTFFEEPSSQASKRARPVCETALDEKPQEIEDLETPLPKRTGTKQRESGSAHAENGKKLDGCGRNRFLGSSGGLRIGSRSAVWRCAGGCGSRTGCGRTILRGSGGGGSSGCGRGCCGRCAARHGEERQHSAARRLRHGTEYAHRKALHHHDRHHGSLVDEDSRQRAPRGAHAVCGLCAGRAGNGVERIEPRPDCELRPATGFARGGGRSAAGEAGASRAAATATAARPADAERWRTDAVAERLNEHRGRNTGRNCGRPGFGRR